MNSRIHAHESSRREEERRRLRRDLHDGVGPTLAAIGLKVSAAAGRDDPAERNTLLTEVDADVKDTIAEIRRVVDDLRPPAIDEVGLMSAIRQPADSLTAETSYYNVAGPIPFPALSAAVEVAAFRIASEAMTNASKHVQAFHCTVDIYVDGALHVVVTDDGRGSTHPRVPGVGWASLTDRATELGGTLAITNREVGGLCVHAVLPLGEISLLKGSS